jgi:uncharacterized protein (DUF2147 family)
MARRSTLLVAAAMGISAFGVPAFASDGDSPSDDAVPLGTGFPPEAIVGEWSTQVEENRPPGRVRFERVPDGTYVGIISWSAEPKKDVHNKDPKLRDRPLVGSVLMWHLRYDDGEYVDGYVYNPEDGGTYRLKAQVLGLESLKIRGFLGISLFGQSKVWSRYHE